MSERAQSGTLTGYSVEYKERDEWIPLEIKITHYPTGARVDGIPFPMLQGGFLAEAWLMGAAQAKAYAWMFAANYEAVHYSSVAVRIIKHEVTFSLEVKKVADEGAKDEN